MDNLSLTVEQIEEFNEQGFLVVDDVFSMEEVEALRRATESEAIMERLNQGGHATKAVHLLEITTLDPIFLNLARDPKILDLLVPLIGPNIQLQHSKLATKPPTKGKGTFAWHQDLAFFPHTNSSVLAVMVMLDDATPENGCMQMVRGSHKLGYLNHSVDGFFTAECQESRYWEDESRVAQITPKTGGISIHNGLTLHGSPANLSGKPRRGIVFEYRADDAYQISDTIWKDTGLLMCGRRGEVVRCEPGLIRLPKQDPESEFYTGHVFGGAFNQNGELVDEADYYRD